MTTKKHRDFNDLPKWIPAQMQRVGIESVEQLAYRAGRLSRMAIYRWLHDQSRPTAQTMVKVCRALDVPLEVGLAQFTPKRNGRPPLPTVTGKARRAGQTKWKHEEDMK